MMGFMAPDEGIDGLLASLRERAETAERRVYELGVENRAMSDDIDWLKERAVQMLLRLRDM